MDTQEYFTPGEVAKRLRVDRTTVKRWIRTRALEATTIRYGTQERYFIPKAAIEEIERRSQHQKLV